MDLISPVCLHHGERRRAADTATDTDTDTAEEMHKRSAVKRSRRAQTVLGDRHDPVERILFASFVGRLRNSPGRIFQRLGTQTESVTNTATESSQRNAFVVSREKSSRGSDSPRRPTRSDLRNFIASAVGRLRNSPERTFQRLGTQADARRNLKNVRARI
jgi:hypothetical protein